MRLLSGLGITKRLYFFSFVLIAALGSLAAASWVQLSNVASLADSSGRVRVQQLMRISGSGEYATAILAQVGRAMLARTPQEVEAAAMEIDRLRRRISENDAGFYNDLPPGPSHDRDAFPAWKALQNQTWQSVDATIKLIESGRRDDAFSLLTTTTVPALKRMQAVLDAAKERQRQNLTSEVYRIVAASSETGWLLTGLVFVIAAALMVFSWMTGRALRHRVAVSQAVAEQVRDGNLITIQADSENDEFSPLLAALRAMKTSLAEVVGIVRSNAEGVAAASSQIATGNADLSARTEEQAGSLEQAASSMTELTETVKQNAENAREANTLAVRATDVADAGNDAVQSMVGTIERISASSTKISEITGVIQGIAFQTNILALNAAVEAARAGEQGRGFAVVASEVRSLAQRSAAAAREIKELIDASVAMIEDGAKQAGSVGATMGEVKRAIKKVSDIVGEIANASEEQSRGVEQVSRAVVQMDEMTQQNVALVEQSAAAALSLDEQAVKLRDAVSVFQLADAAREFGLQMNVPQVMRRMPAPNASAENAKLNVKAAPRTRATADAIGVAPASDAWETF